VFSELWGAEEKHGGAGRSNPVCNLGKQTWALRFYYTDTEQ